MNINKPYIIAEIGINHEGRYDYISKLIYSAKRAGANAVKFQIFTAESLADKNSKIKKNFYKKNKKETLFNMWKRLEIDNKKLNLINSLCKKIKIDLIFSIFDYDSLLRLKKIKIKFIKIASSDINDFPLLERIKKFRKKIIISTGMASEAEIKKIINFFGKKNIFLLHCVSLYPCPENKINLRRIEKLRKKFKIDVGFSDHTIGVNASIIALSNGANILEKHFTLNKKSDGPDHKLSANETDLKLICDFSKKINLLKGNGKINPSKEEMKMLNFARKSIYVKKNIFKNDLFTSDNLEVRRPKGFFEPVQLNKIINKKSSTNIKSGTNLKSTHISH
jgi:N,N'-diacetyllegionaminate synthase